MESVCFAGVICRESTQNVFKVNNTMIGQHNSPASTLPYKINRGTKHEIVLKYLFSHYRKNMLAGLCGTAQFLQDLRRHYGSIYISNEQHLEKFVSSGAVEQCTATVDLDVERHPHDNAEVTPAWLLLVSFFSSDHAVRWYISRLRTLLDKRGGDVFFKLFYYCHDVSLEYVMHLISEDTESLYTDSRFRLVHLVHTLLQYHTFLSHILRKTTRLRPSAASANTAQHEQMDALTDHIANVISDIQKMRERILRTTEYISELEAHTKMLKDKKMMLALDAKAARDSESAASLQLHSRQQKRHERRVFESSRQQYGIGHALFLHALDSL